MSSLAGEVPDKSYLSKYKPLTENAGLVVSMSTEKTEVRKQRAQSFDSTCGAGRWEL